MYFIRICHPCFGIDLYGGYWKYTTAPMSFQEADAWATLTAASNTYTPRASSCVLCKSNALLCVVLNKEEEQYEHQRYDFDY